MNPGPTFTSRAAPSLPLVHSFFTAVASPFFTRSHRYDRSELNFPYVPTWTSSSYTRRNFERGNDTERRVTRAKFRDTANERVEFRVAVSFHLSRMGSRVVRDGKKSGEIDFTVGEAESGTRAKSKALITWNYAG